MDSHLEAEHDIGLMLSGGLSFFTAFAFHLQHGEGGTCPIASWAIVRLF